MPRITKAEVRASMMNEPKKTLPNEKKEKLFREKIKEEQPYPSVTERTEVPRRDEAKLQSSKSEDKENITPIAADNKNQDSATTKKVSISGFDPTPIRRKPVKMLAINEEEINEARQEILDLREKVESLEKEKELLETSLAMASNTNLETDTLKESYEEKIKTLSDEHSSYVAETNEEISSLKSELLIKTKEAEELKQEKEERNKHKTLDLLSTISAYIVFGILAAGIIGLIGLLVAKGLVALGGWLF